MPQALEDKLRSMGPARAVGGSGAGGGATSGGLAVSSGCSEEVDFSSVAIFYKEKQSYG